MLKQITTDNPTAPNLFSHDDALITTATTAIDFVSDDLEKLAVQLISNNELRVKSGTFCIGGHYGYIPSGSYETCYVSPGNIGFRRKDLIVAKYTRVGNLDYIGIQIYTGVPSKGEPVIPTYSVSDLNADGKIREIPLHVVELNGIDIISVTPVFETLTTKDDVSALFTARDYSVFGTQHHCFSCGDIVTDTFSIGMSSSYFTAQKDGVFVMDALPSSNISVEIEDGYTATDVIVIPSTTGSSISKVNINSVILGIKPSTSIYRYVISYTPYLFLSVSTEVFITINMMVRYKKVKL